MKLLQDDQITRILCIFLALSVLPASFIHAQNDCEVPLPPVLKSVTVMPEKSTAVLNWDLSESEDISAYIVYLFDTRDGNSAFFAIDTLWNPMATSYSDTRIQYRNFQYRIAAFRIPKCVSELSNIISTIFVEARLDSCKKEINIAWNKYIPPSPQIVTKYTIYMAVNGGSSSEITSVSPDITNFTTSDVAIGSTCCFNIKADVVGGVASFSVNACLTVDMQKPPQWINADYATVNENGLIDLSFTVDPESEIDHFDLERREGYSGTFNSIFQISGNDSKKITYTDKTIRKNSVYFYRLTAVNNCNIKSVSSNNASNIDLNTINTGNEVILRWNNYKNWNGSVASYRIFMDTGNSFAQFHVASPSDTIYSVSIPGIMYNLTRGEVCFYVSALETGNPHGISGESDSDTSCISIDETVTVPNIFTPDGNGKNDQFKLVLTFAPASYHLLITDQHRKILFETRDYNESWDGMTEAGPLSQGVYLWFLRLKTPSGKSIIRTGTVTIIKN